MTDDSDEDYFDDPIRLFENEQSRVCYSELKISDIIIEDPEIKELTEEENKSSVEVRSWCQEYTPLLPISFFDKERNIELLSQCRPLCIKVVDCMKSTLFNVNKSKTEDVEGDVDGSVLKKQIIDLSSPTCGYKENCLSKNDIDKYKQILKSKMAAFYHSVFDKATCNENANQLQQNQTVNTVFQFSFPGKVKKNGFETKSTASPQDHCNKTIYTPNGKIIQHICDTEMKLKLNGRLKNLKKKNSTNTEYNNISPILNQKSESNSKETFQIESVITNRNPQNYNQHFTGKTNNTRKIPPVGNVIPYLSPKITCNINETHEHAPYFCPTLPTNLVNLTEKPTISKPNQLLINQLQSPLMNVNKQGMLLNTRSNIEQKNQKQNRNNLIYVPNSNHPNTGNAALFIKKSLENKNTSNIVDKHPIIAKALNNSITEKTLESNKTTDERIDFKNNLNDTHSSHMTNENQAKNNKVSVIVRNANSTNTKANHNEQTNNKESYNLNKPNLQEPGNTSKGYSPPILPIPSYEKVFQVISKIKFFYFEGDKMFINADSDNDKKDIPMKNLPQQPIIKPPRKRKITCEREKVPRKITINEYKKRVRSAMNNNKL